MPPVSSLYVHVPFCSSRCLYCDFPSGIPPERESVSAYVRALCLELLTLPQNTLSTVYLGGGTPSLLPPARFETLAGTIRERFPLAPDCEFTLEANPNDVTPGLARLWRSAGVNRVSLGVQSMNPDVLAFLRRRNSPADNARAVETVRAAGIANVSVDWILAVDTRDSGMPEFIARFLPEHVSAYILSVEDGTALKKLAGSGSFAQPDDESTLAQYWRAVETLDRLGYERYEVSNFARGKAFESRHNLNYWNYGAYFGAGMAASAFEPTGGRPFDCDCVALPLRARVSTTPFARRKTNFAGFAAYVEAAGAGRSPAGFTEDIDLPTAMREYVMLGLRKADGFALADFERTFGTKFEDAFGLLSENVLLGAAKPQPKDDKTFTGLLDFDGARLKTTRAGLEKLNGVIVSLWEQLKV